MDQNSVILGFILGCLTMGLFDLCNVMFDYFNFKLKKEIKDEKKRKEKENSDKNI